MANARSAIARNGLRYLFAYFRGPGDEGLLVAGSTDACHWSPLNGERPVLAPLIGSRLMRDPHLSLGPDGCFHLAWTTGWWDRGIGLAHSPDLVSWSEQRFLPVMDHEPALNCWAPEILWDASRGEYLIYWSTTIPGRFCDTDATGDRGQGGWCNHRVYCVATGDFERFTAARVLYDGGFNVIDATIARVDAGPGRRYAMVMKDETLRPTPRKHLRIAFSDAATGPYGPASPPISPDWVEGPSMLRVDGRWIVYYDEYTWGRYGAICSADLERWAVMSHRLRFPDGTSHGNALALPRDATVAL